MATVWIGSWALHPDASELRRGAQRLRLTPLERDLLRYLAERSGQTIAQEELLREVWSYSPNARTRAVFSTIARLRSKLGDDAACIVSVYGLGYRLEPIGDPDLVGRHDELRRLADRLDEARCCVVWGLGGIGKTRLVRAALASAGESIWIDAGGMTASEEVSAALARALDLEAAEGPGLELALQARGPLRVVVDEAEGVGSALLDQVRRWLDAAPELTVVLTSRVLLGDALPGLHVPPLDPADAAVLFRRAAARAGMPVELDDAEVRVLVQRLEGVPLALELAAARTRVLTTRELLERVDQGLAVLEVGGRGLRSTLQLSWALLDPADQRVLRRACLFPGPFRLPQLEAVAGAHVVEALDHLVSASLVVRDGSRWRLLALIRAFVAERVDDADRAAYVRAATDRARALWTDPAQGTDAHRAALVDEAPWLVDALERATAATLSGRDSASRPCAASLSSGHGRSLARDVSTSTTLSGRDSASRPCAATADVAHLAVAVACHDALMGPIGRTRQRLRDLPLHDLPPALGSEVQLRLARQARGDDRGEAVRSAELALALARETSDPEAVVAAWRELTDLTWGQPAHLEHRRDLAAFARAAGGLRPGTRIQLLRDEAALLLRSGQPEEAREQLMTCLALVGDDQLELRCAVVKSLSEALDELGRTGEAVDLLEEAFAAAGPIPGSAARARIGVGLAATLIDAGRAERAAEILPEVLAAAREGGFTAVEAIARLNLAAVTTDPLASEQHCVQAREVARRAGRADLVAGAERRIARRQLARGEAEAALRSFSRALDWLGPWARGRPYLRMQLALAQWAAGDPGAARATLEATEPVGATDLEVMSLVRAAVHDDLDSFETLAEASRSTHSRVEVTIKLIRQLSSRS